MSENKTNQAKTGAAQGSETQGNNPPAAKTPEQIKAEKEAADKKAAEEVRLKKEAEQKEAAKKAEADLEAKIKAAQGDGSYLAKENERGLFHIKLEKPAHDPQTGKKLSKPFIQKFTPVDFKQFETANRGLGYTIVVLWNPEEYTK